MAKINLINEVLKHSDPEIIEYLANLMARVKVAHEQALKEDKPHALYACSTTVLTVSEVLSAVNKRNKQKSGQDEAVVL